MEETICRFHETSKTPTGQSRFPIGRFFSEPKKCLKPQSCGNKVSGEIRRTFVIHFEIQNGITLSLKIQKCSIEHYKQEKEKLVVDYITPNQATV